MAGITFGGNTQNYEKISAAIHTVACAVSVIAFIGSLISEGHTAYLPVIFLMAGVIAWTHAVGQFGENRRVKFRLVRGVLLVILGLLMMVMTYITAVCLWFG